MAEESSNGFLGWPSLDDYSRRVVADLMEGVKTSADFPLGSEAKYYQAFPEYRQRTEALGARVLAQVQGLLDYCAPHTRTDLLAAELEPTERFPGVVEVVDTLLEALDALRDRTHRQSAPAQVLVSSKDHVKVLHGNLPRPQHKFTEPVDNSSRPFVPRLRVKYHALASAPLPAALQHHMGTLGLAASTHPYHAELTAWQPSPTMFRARAPQLYLPLPTTRCTWVDTVDALEAMIAVLATQTEIAVDLENHDYRSYQGFLCLMQISTREEDFLVDVLALRAEMHALGTVFSDPAIVKVLHGADYDILWLQRDLGLYIVNMFDTGQATRVLEFPSFGLAYLLQRFCNVIAQKQYQLADWRLRPLPPELLKYAQEDTHYLLYIYDCLRSELVARSSEGELVRQVLEASRRLCLQTYEKFVLKPDSWRVLYNRHHAVLTQPQQRVFARIYAWRDQQAREDDESVRYVLPNQHLFRVAEALPATVPALLACCVPVPPLLRLHAHDLLLLIKQAQTAEELPVELPAEPLLPPVLPSLGFSLPPPPAYRAAGWLASPPRATMPSPPRLSSPPRHTARIDFTSPPRLPSSTATAIKRSFTEEALTNPHDFQPTKTSLNYKDRRAKKRREQYRERKKLAKQQKADKAKKPAEVVSLEQISLSAPPANPPKRVKLPQPGPVVQPVNPARASEPTFDYAATSASAFQSQARAAGYQQHTAEPRKVKKRGKKKH